MLRLAPFAALLVGLALAVPTAAQVGGEKVLFVNDLGINTVNADGSSPILLRPHGCVRQGCLPIEPPRWSRDGTQIAFVQAVAHAETKLLVINADGGNERYIAGTPTPPDPRFAITRQAWSPDGPYITFGPTPQVDSGDIYTQGTTGGLQGNVRRTFDTHPKEPAAWSPDGTRLLYSSHVQSVRHRSELFVLSLAGGNPTQITSSGPGAALNESPTWSSDGSLIAFSRSVGGEPKAIHVVRPDGTGLRRVSTVGGERPAWSSDGQKLAFSSPSGTGRDLYVVNVDGSDEKRITQSGPDGVQNDDVTWAPRGGRLLFTSIGSASKPTLYTVNPDGKCPRLLAEGWGGMWQPSEGVAVSTGCRTLGVVTSSVPNRERSGALITATLLNEGTERIDGVRMRISSPRGYSVLSATPSRGSCTVQGGLQCSIGTLDLSQEVEVAIRVEGRRVTPNTPIGALIRVDGESLDDPVLRYVTLTLATCGTQARGAGRIVGTSRGDEICGRRGRDTLVGGDGNDRLRGGLGADVMMAGRGRDTVLARDKVRDQVSCGPGRDSVVVDRRDRVARDCERVSRR